MEKYIGFDVDYKKTVACVVQEGRGQRYQTLPTRADSMRQWLGKQRKSGDRLHLTFEVSGLVGYLHDELIGEVDGLTVSNPLQMTWIYHTAKKADRIDACKQALLLKMGQVPSVHMPNRQIRQWRQQIQHRRNLANSCTQIKNRIRALLKSRGFDRPAHAGGYWKYANRQWM